MNSDGSNQMNISKNKSHNFTPSWSPDGKWIAFLSTEGGSYNIFIMRPDGSERTNLTPNSGEDKFDGKDNDLHWKFGTAWSPDSKRIAFTNRRNGMNQVYIINVDGSNLTRLTDGSGDCFNPSWSPNLK